MINSFLIFLLFSVLSHAQVCKNVPGQDNNNSSITTRSFDLAQIAEKNGLELRFESYLESDLHLITSAVGRLKFVVSFADGSAASYPRKWCSLNFIAENGMDLVEMVSDWDSCKAIAFQMRDYAKKLNNGVILHASAITNSNRLNLEFYCNP